MCAKMWLVSEWQTFIIELWLNFIGIVGFNQCHKNGIEASSILKFFIWQKFFLEVSKIDDVKH